MRAIGVFDSPPNLWTEVRYEDDFHFLARQRTPLPNRLASRSPGIVFIWRHILARRHLAPLDRRAAERRRFPSISARVDVIARSEQGTIDFLGTIDFGVLGPKRDSSGRLDAARTSFRRRLRAQSPSPGRPAKVRIPSPVASATSGGI